jgi:hypothetical protein
MALTNVGVDLMASAVIGAAYTPFNNANAYIGVGDSTTAFAKTQTDLQASPNKAYKAMDASYPLIASGNVLTFESTFSTTDANFAWQEWAVFNAPSGGVMLNRKVESLGTKPNTQIWVFTVTLTVNNP